MTGLTLTLLAAEFLSFSPQVPSVLNPCSAGSFPALAQKRWTGLKGEDEGGRVAALYFEAVCVLGSFGERRSGFGIGVEAS